MINARKMLAEYLPQVTFKERKVKLESSLSAVFKEQQQKVNAVNRLFKKKYNSNLFQEEAFIRFARTQLRKFSHLI